MAIKRLWLDVPFKEKDDAKRFGARWDPIVKRWYAPHPGIAGLQKWAPAPDIPELLPGEDRTLGQGLFVDLVPSSCWFTNVRSCVAPRDWERLRRMVVRRAQQRCEICGATENRDAKQWLEVHERWIYDDLTRIQILKRLICLCSDCHHVTHYGFATQVLGIESHVFAHLMNVTRMTAVEARLHIDAAFSLWQRRSQMSWHLDLRMLTDAGITLAPPPEAADRPWIADQVLLARK